MNLGPWSCDKKEVMIVWKEMMLGSWTRIVWKEECMTVCMKKSSRTLVASSNFWLVHFGISQFSAPVFSSKRERSCSCVCGAMPKKEVNFATSWQKWCSALISYICIHLRKANRLIPRAVLSSTPSSVLFSFAPRPVAGTRPRKRSAQLHLPSGLLDKVRHKDREASLLPATHTSSPYRALHFKQYFWIFENWKKKMSCDRTLRSEQTRADEGRADESCPIAR